MYTPRRCSFQISVSIVFKLLYTSEVTLLLIFPIYKGSMSNFILKFDENFLYERKYLVDKIKVITEDKLNIADRISLIINVFFCEMAMYFDC